MRYVCVVKNCTYIDKRWETAKKKRENIKGMRCTSRNMKQSLHWKVKNHLSNVGVWLAIRSFSFNCALVPLSSSSSSFFIHIHQQYQDVSVCCLCIYTHIFGIVMLCAYTYNCLEDSQVKYIACSFYIHAHIYILSMPFSNVSLVAAHCIGWVLVSALYPSFSSSSCLTRSPCIHVPVPHLFRGLPDNVDNDNSNDDGGLLVMEENKLPASVSIYNLDSHVFIYVWPLVFFFFASIYSTAAVTMDDASGWADAYCRRGHPYIPALEFLFYIVINKKQWFYYFWNGMRALMSEGIQLHQHQYLLK